MQKAQHDRWRWSQGTMLAFNSCHELYSKNMGATFSGVGNSITVPLYKGTGAPGFTELVTRLVSHETRIHIQALGRTWKKDLVEISFELPKLPLGENTHTHAHRHSQPMETAVSQAHQESALCSSMTRGEVLIWYLFLFDITSIQCVGYKRGREDTKPSLLRPQPTYSHPSHFPKEVKAKQLDHPSG